MSSKISIEEPELFEIKFPQKFTNGYFYSSILHQVIKAINKKVGQVIFNMEETELTNPSAIINMVAPAALIKRHLNKVVYLILPEKQPILKYLSYCGLINYSEVPWAV